MSAKHLQHSEAYPMSYDPCIGMDDCPPASFAPTPREDKRTRRSRRARMRSHTRGREPGNRRIRKALRAADRATGLALQPETLRAFVDRAFGPRDTPAPHRVAREIRTYVSERDRGREGGAATPRGPLGLQPCEACGSTLPVHRVDFGPDTVPAYVCTPCIGDLYGDEAESIARGLA